MSNKIYYQGELDGACFLYSMVNALSKLNMKKSKSYISKIWEERLKDIPFLEDYIIGDGTRRLDDNEFLIIEACERFFNYYEKNRKDYQINMVYISSPMEILDYLESDSAVIIDVDNGKHWQCLVGKNEAMKKIYSACSLPENENRQLNTKSNINYNRILDVHGLRVFKKRFIHIKKI